jgi:hypothetical protein
MAADLLGRLVVATGPALGLNRERIVGRLLIDAEDTGIPYFVGYPWPGSWGTLDEAMEHLDGEVDQDADKLTRGSWYERAVLATPEEVATHQLTQAGGL